MKLLFVHLRNRQPIHGRKELQEEDLESLVDAHSIFNYRHASSGISSENARPSFRHFMRNLVERMRTLETRTPELVDEYYTACIPFYREFLGNHWHTGYYLSDNRAIGPQDQLRMEWRIAESADITPDSQVLDVGCGIGGPACHLAKRSGARFWGLTPNATQLELARQLAIDEHVADQVTFDQGFANALPYPDESFDVVLFFESPCHFPDRDQFFREVLRVLRPNGRLAGEDWLAADGLSPIQRDQYLQPIYHTWAIPRLGTILEYRSAMEAAGLVVREATDLRDEMALSRGFLTSAADRDAVRRERDTVSDPIRKVIMDGLLVLGEAVEAGAFTLGRFLGAKP